MDEKKFKSPGEVREFLDSDAFADGFKKWLVTPSILTAVGQHLEPLLLGWKRLMKTAAPVVSEVVSELEKWNFSSEVLGKAGWLPHYTTPFRYIAECGEDNEAVRSQLLDYYKNNWQNVRSEIESRLSDYKIDAEAKATFREALDAHEAGLYRCVCRVLFPEIERIFRIELFNNIIGSIAYKKFLEKLVDKNKSIDEYIIDGLYDLSIFGHLTKTLRKEAISESDKLTVGLFTSVTSEEHRERLKQSAIPNRHAAIHGLVAYSSRQNSLNMIFLADYIFRIVGSAIPLPSPWQ